MINPSLFLLTIQTIKENGENEEATNLRIIVEISTMADDK